ncbi:MAG: histidine--tRNA ligase [Parcubacteria group bacterium]|nr:histidine--tRNA ligase [Parcubacteria group bacterium]
MPKAKKKTKKTATRTTPKTSPKVTSRKKKEALRAVKGVKDILPKEMKIWDYCQSVIKKQVEPYGFQKVEMPILEKTELFERGTGEGTDIVQKEMFSFSTKGGEKVTLRPEGTPGVLRSYIEHGMHNKTQPVKVYYIGPMYRHERPQAGRYRQFHQFNLEAIGNDQPILDAEVIHISTRILKKLGLDNIEVQINSLGCPECRKDYKETLINFYAGKRRRLCDDCKKRLRRNPFRVLDCKKDKCQAVSVNVPPVVDYLCEECNDHFKRVLEYLDEVEVTYNLNSTLMRGLDYYTRTVFEFWPADSKEAAQSSLGGGGRYDGLMGTLGGRSTPGLGVALGMERIIASMQEKEVNIRGGKSPDVLLIQLGELAKKKSLRIFSELVDVGVSVREALHKDSIKSQLRLANKLGVRLAVIIGQKEATEDTVLIRDMADGVQEIVKMSKLVDEIKKGLKKKIKER